MIIKATFSSINRKHFVSCFAISFPSWGIYHRNVNNRWKTFQITEQTENEFVCEKHKRKQSNKSFMSFFHSLFLERDEMKRQEAGKNHIYFYCYWAIKSSEAVFELFNLHSRKALNKCWLLKSQLCNFVFLLLVPSARFCYQQFVQEKSKGRPSIGRRLRCLLQKLKSTSFSLS